VNNPVVDDYLKIFPIFLYLAAVQVSIPTENRRPIRVRVIAVWYNQSVHIGEEM
jgi:hypothetical protein